MAVVLKCPDCEQKFRWDFADEQRWPKACPLCGANTDHGVPDDVIVMPALRSPKTAATDESYRQLERSSEHRMEQAAAAAGTSVADMSALKITDLKTNIVPGETYVPEVRNAVTERMDQMKQMGAQVGFAGAAASEFAGQVKTGPYPNAGAKAMQSIQRLMGKG